MECIVAHCIFNAVEECRNLLIGLFRHSCQHIFNQMRLVAPTRFNNQFAWRSTLFRKNTNQYLALAHSFSFIYPPILHESPCEIFKDGKPHLQPLLPRPEVGSTSKGTERSDKMSFNFCLDAICVPGKELATRSYVWAVAMLEGYQ